MSYIEFENRFFGFKTENDTKICPIAGSSSLNPSLTSCHFGFGIDSSYATAASFRDTTALPIKSSESNVPES